MSLITIFRIFFCLISITLLPFGITNYTGNKFVYLVFTLLSIFSVLFSFRNKSIAFESFFSLLIWLGFWFKITVQMSFLNSQFPEGFGSFDFTPASYDELLIVTSIAIIGFLSSTILREKFIFCYTKEANTKHDSDYLIFYNKYRKQIIYFYYFLFLIISIMNFIFVFYQKGTVPEIKLPLNLNYLFTWSFMFGLSSIASIFIFFEFKFKKKNENLFLKIGLLETFFSSISILSRAMIFNGTALIFGFYRLVEFGNIRIIKKKFIIYFLILLTMFVLSLFIVSKVRQNKEFNVGHHVHTYIPEFKPDKIISKNQILVIEGANEAIKEINHIMFLIAGRFVGAEGLMATIGDKSLGFSTFFESFKEEFNFSNSFYEKKIKKSIHEYSKNPSTYTIYTPGVVAFLYYTKSNIFVYLGILILCVFCSIIERAAFQISFGNYVLSYLIGNVLAYRLAHFGYMPQNSYKIILAIIFNLILVYFIIKIIKLFSNK